MLKIIATLSFLLLLSSCALGGAKATNSMTLVALESTHLLSSLHEISGLASTNKRYWGVNDSGGETALYGFDKQNVNKMVVVTINNALNIDWEDLAQDEQFVYIADSGDNFALRGTINIYKIEKQQLNAITGNGQVTSKRLTISYSDKHNVLPQRNHNFDSEALSVVNDELWLFSKNRGDGNTKLYIIDKEAATQTVAPIASFAVNGLITGADYDPKTGQLLLLGYSRKAVFGQSFIWRVDVIDQQLNWDSAKRYRIKPFAQWESIKWVGEDRFIIGAEDSPLSKQKIAQFQLP
ncbi:MAG: hypothetical protein HRU06_07335 [Oceanospirillaceae bacterium]|nr:hypothetical protein [Oceanospirillaceae bacterium]